MGDKISNDDSELIDSIRSGGRPAKIDSLFMTNEGKQRFSRALLMLASRASLKSVALSIGINPDTLSRWLRKGKQDGDSLYGRFYRECVSAISHAVVDAEMDINQQKPEFYLTRGAGRLVVGDLYNITGQGELEYGLDGSISPAGQSPTSINNSDADESNTQHVAVDDDNSIDDAMAKAALLEMSSLGIDVGDQVNKKISDEQSHVRPIDADADNGDDSSTNDDAQ